jgi:hypothetical protein
MYAFPLRDQSSKSDGPLGSYKTTVFARVDTYNNDMVAFRMTQNAAFLGPDQDNFFIDPNITITFGRHMRPAPSPFYVLHGMTNAIQKVMTIAGTTTFRDRQAQRRRLRRARLTLARRWLRRACLTLSRRRLRRR